MRRRWGLSAATCSGWKLFVAGGGLVLASATPVAAQGYSTTALVNANHNECRGIPECSSNAMPAVTVPARGRISTRFVCPESHPNFWSWDVALHEHVGAELLTSDRKGATIEATNHADVEGLLVVYFGCSSKPYDGDSVLVFRRMSPTGWIRRGVRTPNATSLSE